MLLIHCISVQRNPTTSSGLQKPSKPSKISSIYSAPILEYPDPDGHLILDTDGSAHAIGAVLPQIQQGEERVLAYYSRALSKLLHH